MSYQLVEGDTGVVIRITCEEGEPLAPIDLTGYTAQLRWRSDSAVFERVMQIPNPANGQVQYLFLAGEITAADMEFEVVLTSPSGVTRSSLQTFRQRVREKLS